MTPNQVSLNRAPFLRSRLLGLLEWPLLDRVATGFVFMVLDTVDGKLARCTASRASGATCSTTGVDLVHPPFWWWAWLQGLGAAGHQLEEVYKGGILAVIVGTYVLGRVIEGLFMWRFGMHIHVWQAVDSRFRLVTARRNPNMVILVAALAVGRPTWASSWSPCGRC
jgi:type IV secretory pathway TrbD component